MSKDSDRRYMALALSLGRRGMGRVWPNPAVGCVIVAQGRVVGRGWTADGGRPHAETQALRQAGLLAKGADVYVTLEPCAHHGQTAPCAEALIKAGVARVVIACGDPDPRVAGKGIALLRDAGFDVTAGVLQEEAEADHAGFFARLCHEKPYVTLKLATSVDGRIATATGESQWITGGLARRAVHMLRARHDAVMVGAGTMRADDPMLTVRGIGVDRQPVRVVVSRHLNISRDSKLVQTAHDVPLWVCHGPRADFSAWETSGAQSMTCTLKGGQLDPRSVMSGLAAKGLTRVFCEGGGSLAASLLDAELVDELVIFQAGMTIGAEGTPGIAALGLERLSDAPRFVLKELRQIGADTMQVWQKTAP